MFIILAGFVIGVLSPNLPTDINMGPVTAFILIFYGILALMD